MSVLNEMFYDCIAHDGMVAVATASAEGIPHMANTWNKYLIVTDDEKILIPCFGFIQTEKNNRAQPHVEITVGSPEVQGKMGMGTGCLLVGTAAFYKEGPLFDQMKAKCDFANRVLVFTPESCKQTI
ncbi:pyridoxamine 5'-phosphate oxidase family protein [Pseudoramibacter alactolyticus]|uniref:pyridoxamine 5'-phosphate oxidase family protein n=1 Tax=Pseudoramibacter alactolyticus TaxID=113287 RepID=UPI00248DA222|nr:pyridoxamine 5'-phosphate oxidase family protein [Pseudoramibacter alactolyticus]